MRKTFTYITTLGLAVLFSFTSCQTPTSDTQSSDTQKIADLVMTAMGGEENWAQTQHIFWDFFGYRKLYWDKGNDRVRVEIPEDQTIILVDLNTGEGRAQVAGTEIEDPQVLSEYLKKGKSAWINDSYWLVMPYKLQDPGVTLSYLGVEVLEGREADKIELTFNEVGETPNNKYWVYVDKESNLVVQWDFFRNATDEKAMFSNPWKAYKRHGKIFLSGDRGNRQLTEIEVREEVADALYESFEEASSVLQGL